MVPFIFKPVFVCIFTVHADENWLENERNHIQGRKNDLNMLLLRSTNSMSCPIWVEAQMGSLEISGWDFGLLSDGQTSGRAPRGVRQRPGNRQPSSCQRARPSNGILVTQKKCWERERNTRTFDQLGTREVSFRIKHGTVPPVPGYY